MENVNGKQFSVNKYFSEGVAIAYSLKGNMNENRLGDILFLNGLFTGMSSWAGQARLRDLLSNFRLIFFDYPCQGSSENIEEPFSFDQLIERILHFLNFMNLKQPILVGHSFGGILANMIVSDNRYSMWINDQIRGVVLVNTPLDLPLAASMIFNDINRRLKLLNLSIMAGQECESVGDIFRSLIPCAFGEEYLKLIHGYETEVLRSYSINNSNPVAVAFLIDSIMSKPRDVGKLRRDLENLSLPVLVVAGDDDKIFPVIVSNRLAGCFQNSKLVVFEGSGHSTMIECKKKFNEELLSFIFGLDF